jgi:hypothetical protein
MPDFLALPDAPAVCIFESAESPARTILLATTASARDLARRRFGDTADTSPAKSARPDLHALCTGGRIHAIAVGSSLEADAVYLRQARERLPHLAKVVAERWRAWFIHVDPDAEFPQWTKTNLSIGLVGKRSASTLISAPSPALAGEVSERSKDGGGTSRSSLPPGLLLGPIPNKDAAGSLIESVIDCFDLCRYHHLLVQAPKALACAYKEMGRCPAPCDGTEAMHLYRDRTRAAAHALVEGATSAIELAEAAMHHAAATKEFEKAARLQKSIARLRALDKPAFAHVRPLHLWQELFILPSAVRNRATLALFDRGTLLRVADIDSTDNAAISTACEAAVAYLGNSPIPTANASISMHPETIDTIALASRWLFTPKAKRKGEAIKRIDSRFKSEHVQIAAESLRKSKKQAIEIEGQEIEGTN